MWKNVGASKPDRSIQREWDWEKKDALRLSQRETKEGQHEEREKYLVNKKEKERDKYKVLKIVFLI